MTAINKKIIILGGLGTGSVIAAAIREARLRSASEWDFAGYLNDREETGALISGAPVLGKTAEIRKFVDEGYCFLNTIYRIDGQRERIAMFEGFGIPDESLATFIHPMAYVAPGVVLGPGSVVMPNAYISPDTVLGKCCLVMANVSIGHNDVIGDHCHIAAQAAVGSYLRIGRGVHIGLNCSIRENLVIGDYATTGMGSVLTKNVGDNEIWTGNPAKFLRHAT